MNFILLSLLAMAPASASASASAVDAETRAFAAIDDARWCDAAALFDQAHRLAPSPTLLNNAGEAAVKAGDIRWAKALLVEQKRSASRKSRRTLARRIRVISRQKQNATCSKIAPVPPTPPSPEAPDVLVSPPDASDAPTPGAESTTEATPPSTSTAGPATPPPGAPGSSAGSETRPSAAASSTPWLSFAGLGAAGGGAVVVAAGVSLGVLGALPWFAYADAQSRLTEAERQGQDGASAFADQVTAESQWASFGQPVAIAAPIVVGLGATVMLAGVVLWLVAPEAGSEETAE